MNKLFLFLGYLLIPFCVNNVLSQTSDKDRDYQEATFSQDSRILWNPVKNDINLSWISTDMRFDKNTPPSISPIKTMKTAAWKGETIHLQTVVWSKKDLGQVRANLENISSGKIKIPDENIQVSAVRYVITDELNKDKKGTCGYRYDKTVFDSSLVSDVIDIKSHEVIKAYETRPFWVKIKIPADIKSGTYKGKLTFDSPELPALMLEIKILDYILPEPKNWKFHLDLWQNPYSVARYYNVPLWSEEHLELMKPVMKILADAGQKVITATIMHKPWNGQTYDHFESMVTRIKKLDGSWQYDYAVFDKWVEFMMSMGIDGQINCFTMIPWDLSFQYFDQASDQLKAIKAEPGTPEFANYWMPFLADFASHLKKKGWFEKTTIAMDERPMKRMQQVIELIRKADPKFKISLAGNYHAEIENDLYDYCVALRYTFPDEVLVQRKKDNKVSTVYTCCTEPYPNTFSFSPPAESAWFGWYAAAKGFDGYLRWAYNSWTENPLVDSRFISWGAGDCFFVYPGGRSSIRMEKLIEGIQDFEKIRLLREKFQKEKNHSKLKKLDDILQSFEVKNLKETSAEEMINKAKRELNKL